MTEPTNRLAIGRKVGSLTICSEVDAEGYILTQCKCSRVEKRSAANLRSAASSAANSSCLECRNEARRRGSAIVRRYRPQVAR